MLLLAYFIFRSIICTRYCTKMFGAAGYCLTRKMSKAVLVSIQIPLCHPPESSDHLEKSDRAERCARTLSAAHERCWRASAADLRDSIGFGSSPPIFSLGLRFRYCPQKFYQMYSVHGFVRGEAAPLVICLMENKQPLQQCPSGGTTQGRTFEGTCTEIRCE